MSLREFAYMYLKGKYRPFLLTVEGTGLQKRRMFGERNGISVVDITLLQLVFDSTSILAA
jgi:hypothetical protein